MVPSGQLLRDETEQRSRGAGRGRRPGGEGVRSPRGVRPGWDGGPRTHGEPLRESPGRPVRVRCSLLKLGSGGQSGSAAAAPQSLTVPGCVCSGGG